MANIYEYSSEYISVPSQHTIELPVTSQIVSPPAVLSKTIDPPTAGAAPTASQNQSAPTRASPAIRLGTQFSTGLRVGRRLPTPPIEQPKQNYLQAQSQAAAQFRGPQPTQRYDSESNSNQSQCGSSRYGLQVAPRFNICSSIASAPTVSTHSRSRSAHISHLHSPSNPLPTLLENPTETLSDTSESPRTSLKSASPAPPLWRSQEQSPEPKSLAAAEARHQALLVQLNALTTALENEFRRSAGAQRTCSTRGRAALSTAAAPAATTRSPERTRLSNWLANAHQNPYGSLPDRVNLGMGLGVGLGTGMELVHDLSVPEGLAFAESDAATAYQNGSENRNRREKPVGTARAGGQVETEAAALLPKVKSAETEGAAREQHADLRRLVLEDERLRERIARESGAFRTRIAQENEWLRERVARAQYEREELLARVQLMRRMLLCARRELIERLDGTDV